VTTYKAIQVSEPGKMNLVQLPIREPGPGQVRLCVEACGVCHSDAATVEALLPIDWPRVPGHEVVGRIDALGSGVQGWAVGQRVGVGFLGGACGYCEFCRSGDLVNCRNQEYTGIHHDAERCREIFSSATRRETLGKHLKGDRRGGELKIDWTKPPPRARPMCIDCGLDLWRGSEGVGTHDNP
jgi:alcohol dehydrogenase, propanol-preferring